MSDPLFVRGDVLALCGEKCRPLDSSAVTRLAVVQIPKRERAGSGGASRSLGPGGEVESEAQG